MGGCTSKNVCDFEFAHLQAHLIYLFYLFGEAQFVTFAVWGVACVVVRVRSCVCAGFVCATVRADSSFFLSFLFFAKYKMHTNTQRLMGLQCTISRQVVK